MANIDLLGKTHNPVAVAGIIGYVLGLGSDTHSLTLTCLNVRCNVQLRGVCYSTTNDLAILSIFLIFFCHVTKGEGGHLELVGGGGGRTLPHPLRGRPHMMFLLLYILLTLLKILPHLAPPHLCW